MDTIYLFSLIHFIFVLGILFLWMLIDRKYDYKNYFKITITVGVLGALVFDFSGVTIFKFWGYYSTNILEYLAITVSTYIIATPLFIEVFNYFLRIFGRINLNYKFPLNDRRVRIIFWLSIIPCAWTVTLHLIGLIAISWLFLFTIFICSIVSGDALVYLLTKKKGPFLRSLEGEIFAPVAIFLGGFICGFVWEILNTYAPLWYYRNALPPEKIIGIPLAVIIFWGALLYGYWVLQHLLGYVNLTFTKLELF